MAPDSPRRSRLALAICLITGLYWLTIFALTHAPIVPVPNLGRAGFDKLAHLAVFAGLAFLLCAAGTSLGYAPRRLIVAVLAIAALYGVFDEFTQGFVPHRSPDYRDWFADMLGAGIGITAFIVARESWLAFYRLRAANL